MANKNLTNAKRVKNDEFYTQYSDIQKEIEAYKIQSNLSWSDQIEVLAKARKEFMVVAHMLMARKLLSEFL